MDATKTKEENCPACFGTKQDNALTVSGAENPLSKCPVCKGTGKTPAAS
jgi:DnaJ-class molecular chaperone